MHTVLFYYTLTILLICVLAAATSLSAFFVSHRRTFVYAFLCFLFYFFDVALVFQSDFISQNLTYRASSFWSIGNPYLSILTGTGTLLFLWLVVCNYLNERRAVVLFAPAVVYAVLSATILLTVEDARWHEFLFYSMREVFLGFMLGSIALRYLTVKDDIDRARMRHFRAPFVVALALTGGIIIENIYFQLIFDPLSLDPESVWFIAERSFCENMLFVSFAAVIFRESFRTLSLRFDRPPQRDDDNMQISIDRILPIYCKRTGLSERESEVLRLVILGKDNQNIASEMHLALSTVKVHVHNILKKTGQLNRRELVQHFWKG